MGINFGGGGGVEKTTVIENGETTLQTGTTALVYADSVGGGSWSVKPVFDYDGYTDYYITTPKNGYVYVISGGNSTDHQKYSIEDETWTSVDNTYGNNQGYYLHRDGTKELWYVTETNVYVYNANSDTWDGQLTSVPVAPETAEMDDTALYVGGAGSLHVYDIAIGGWSSTSIPGGHNRAYGMGLTGDYVVIWGGFDSNNNPVTTTYLYDRAEGNWYQGVNFPGGVAGYANTTIRGSPWSINDQNDNMGAYKYDVASDSWTEKPSPPLNAANEPRATSTKDVIYFTHREQGNGINFLEYKLPTPLFVSNVTARYVSPLGSIRNRRTGQTGNDIHCLKGDAVLPAGSGAYEIYAQT